MREIKFRGKKFCQDEWIYGSLITRGERGADGNFIDTGRGECYPLQQDTIGQYTGLHDKNGNEIYEGDIFHIGDQNLLHEVLWHDTGLIGKQIGCYGSYIGLEHWADSIEVIGNVHDNPELLKGGEKWI